MENEIDVKALRADIGMTQAQLAEEVGVDQSTISSWENGTKPRGPARRVLLSIAAQHAAKQDVAQ